MRLEEKITTIGDSADLLSGFAFKSANFSNEKKHAFLVKGSNVGHMSIDYDAGPWWANHEDPKIQKYLLQNNDVILAMDRPIVGDQLKYSWIKPNSPKSLLVQRVARLRGKEGLETDYLRYVIGSHEFQAYVETITTGANVPHISSPDIKKYRFPLPDIKTQQKIAGLLSAYDDLIENNLKRIKLLEEMAQITYEEWFVRLRFPGHESTPINPETNLPEGWERKAISRIIAINPPTSINRGEPQPFIPMQALSTNSMVISPIEFKAPSGGARFQDGDVLLARITPCLENGKTGMVVLSGAQKSGTGSTEFIVMRESSTVNRYFIYCLARSDYFRGNSINAMRGSDGRQRVDPRVYQKLRIPCPPVELMRKFETTVAPNFRVINNLVIQNEKLREARDILLPRLMTGMIDVEQFDPAKLLNEAA